MRLKMGLKANKKWRMMAVVIIIAAIVASARSPQTAGAAEADVMVFAAASTTNAVTEIGELYASRKLGRVKTSFASSSTLAKQIESGAPADVYLSANKKWMDYLEEKKLLFKDSRTDLLSNRIVLIAKADSAIQAIEIAPGFRLIDKLGRDGRLSMGDPAHVPAGMYGQQALEALGCWNDVQKRVAPMKDVRAALALVERGETPLGLVYATDAAVSKKVRVIGTFPPDSHPPIVYPAAAVAEGRADAATGFLKFLKTPAARKIFEKYGFEVR